MTEEHTLVKDQKISFSKTSDPTLNAERIKITLDSHASLDKFPNLTTLSDAIFKNESIWICGRKRKNVFKTDKTVFLQVTIKDYKVQNKLKQGKKIPAASIMVPSEEVIFCAEKGGNCIFAFDPSARHFKSVYTNSDLAIAAMCFNNENAFLIDQKESQYLRILDFSFYPLQNVPFDIGKTDKCQFDIEFHQFESKKCVIVCKSRPQACVLAVDTQDGNILWEINSSKNEPVGTNFNPCSVTISDAGYIFIADTDKVRRSLIYKLGIQWIVSVVENYSILSRGLKYVFLECLV